MPKTTPTEVYERLRAIAFAASAGLTGCYIDYDVGRDPPDSETSGETGDGGDGTGDETGETTAGQTESSATARPRPRTLERRARREASHPGHAR